jgi:hypothetical protein
MPANSARWPTRDPNRRSSCASLDEATILASRRSIAERGLTPAMLWVGARLEPATGNLIAVTDPLIELRARLEEAAARLKSGELDPEAALAVIEECVSLASEASAQVEERTRAALEPLPDLPGQLPLPAG